MNRPPCGSCTHEKRDRSDRCEHDARDGSAHRYAYAYGWLEQAVKTYLAASALLDALPAKDRRAKWVAEKRARLLAELEQNLDAVATT